MYRFGCAGLQCPECADRRLPVRAGAGSMKSGSIGQFPKTPCTGHLGNRAMTVGIC
jgi:hypothetical protein